MSIADWVRFGSSQDDFYRRNRFSGSALVTHTVSKTFDGQYKNDVTSKICESPKQCLHHHFPGVFNCKSLVPYKCDSEFSQTYLQGKLGARFDATFGHTDDVPFAKNLKEITDPRGFFFGGFDMFDENDTRFVDGCADGMVNIGLVHDPLRDPAEECHHLGRWYGRVNAGVTLPNNETAFLTAMLALDVKYENNPSWLGIEFVGTMEGMLIRDCTEEGK